MKYNSFIKLICLSFLTIFLASCKFEERAFINQCEEIYKKKLKSPSSYNRVDYEIIAEKISRKEYEQRERDNWNRNTVVSENQKEEFIFSALKNYDSGKSVNPNIVKAVISYDASNSFGALMRGAFVCSYYDENYDGNPSKQMHNLLISINGMKSSDFLYGDN